MPRISIDLEWSFPLQDGPVERLLTAAELGERWQVPAAHVYRLAREGRLPVVRLGRYTRFRFDAIEAFEQAGGCLVGDLKAA